MASSATMKQAMQALPVVAAVAVGMVYGVPYGLLVALLILVVPSPGGKHSVVEANTVDDSHKSKEFLLAPTHGVPLSGEARYHRILAVDGGGIRGIIAGCILAKLEEIIQAKTGNPDARLADVFDMFAGTSTGGIIAAGICVPQKTGTLSRPKYSVADAAGIYDRYGPKIFPTSLWHSLRTGFGLFGPKYSVAGFSSSVHAEYGSYLMSDLVKPCLLTSYDIHRRTTYFIKASKAKASASSDFNLAEACLATSAAPSYFPVRVVKAVDGSGPHGLIDGGVVANNPAMIALAESRKDFGCTLEGIVLLSVGCGMSPERHYSATDAKSWGKLQWAAPVIDVLNDASAEVVDQGVAGMFSMHDRHHHYVRLQVDLPGAPSHTNEMDNASAGNRQELHDLAAKYLLRADVLARLDQFSDMLLAKRE